jgi:iron complex transport system substrate-binding protein
MTASACRAFAFCLLLFAASLLPQSVSAEGAAKRIVTLGGDITEIVYQLGEEARLVGRDRTSNFPRKRRPCRMSAISASSAPKACCR